MSVENLNVIDFASIDTQGNVVLTISDHLEWDEKNEHLLTLQNKINAYLKAIENGSLYEEYPSAKNKNIIIDVVMKNIPNEDGKRFLEYTKEILDASGYQFKFSLFRP